MTESHDQNSAVSNEERLLQLYDPAYVRRVTTPAGAPPVQVCLDSRMLGVEAGTGVATYAAVLARCLTLAGAAPAILDDEGAGGERGRPRLSRWLSALDHRARVARDRDGVSQSTDPRQGPGWAASDLFREAQVFFNLHGRLLPVACERPPQVMHWTYPVPLFVQGARNLYTVHDLIPQSDPALTTIPRERHWRLLQQILAYADGLVTVSETMRQAIIDQMGCAPGFVTNTYQAAFTPLQRDPPLPAGLRPGRYFLFCGTVEPRKNLLALMVAHARSRADLPLVIVGPTAVGNKALEAALCRAPHVVRLPWQPRTVLLGLIRRARALLFPSLAEGFGLPIAEAMTLGTPVMTSDRGAPAEVAGGAARLVDPGDIAAMAVAISALALDDALCAKLRAAGFDRARAFSLDIYRRQLRALYAEIMDAPIRSTDGEGRAS